MVVIPMRLIDVLANAQPRQSLSRAREVRERDHLLALVEFLSHQRNLESVIRIKAILGIRAPLSAGFGMLAGLAVRSPRRLAPEVAA